jgi:hypothetical protein
MKNQGIATSPKPDNSTTESKDNELAELPKSSEVYY